MRLAFVIAQLDCGGAEQQLVTLCQGLRRRDHEVHVVSVHDRTALKPELDECGIPRGVARKHGTYDVTRAWPLMM